MEEQLSNVRKSIIQNLRDNEIASLIVPEKCENKVKYQFFSYLGQADDGTFIIYNICSLIENIDGKITKKDINEHNILKITGIEPRNYKEYIELENQFYNSLTKVLPIIYKEDISLTEKEDIENMKKAFNKLVVPDMKKLYSKYFPNFMNWIEKF